MRLSGRLALVLGGISLLPLAVVGLLAYQGAVRSHTETAFRDLDVLAEHKRAQFEQWVAENLAAVLELAVRPAVRSYVAALTGFRARRIEAEYLERNIREGHLRPALQLDRDLRELFLLDAASGEVMVSTDEAREGLDYAEQRFFIMARERSWVESPYRSIPEGVLQMTVTAPVRDDDGRLVAVIGAHLDLSQAGDIMTRGQHRSASIDGYLVNRHRLAVTAPRFRDREFVGAAMRTEGIEQCLGTGDGQGVYSDYRGSDVYGVYKLMEQWDLCLVVEIDRADALAELPQFKAVIVSTVVILVLAVLGLVMFVSSRVSRPIDSTIAALERIGRGDLEVRLLEPADGEIRRLFDGVNAMVDSLREVTASRDDLDREVFQRERIAVQLEHSRRRLATMLSNLPGMAFRGLNRRDGELLYVSAGAREILGLDPAQLEHNREVVFGDLIHPAEREAVRSAVQSAVARSEPYEIEYRIRHADGSWRWVLERGQVVSDRGETPEVIEGILIDVTERVRLARELQQAQKMEVLGQVTGGVAHDFNNLLGVILGYVSLSAKALGDREPEVSEKLDHVIRATERARDIVAQMLAFSRGEVDEGGVLDVRRQMERSLAMIRSTLPASIEVVTYLEDEVPPIRLTAAQLDQILMNLCINARDAMDGRGRVVISLFVRYGIRVDCGRGVGAIDGDFVEISVADTGPGVPVEIADRIFDPFFTSKEVGKGTGLGLSVVDGILRSHGGCVILDNHPGDRGGAEFRLLFPAVSGTRPAEETRGGGVDAPLDGAGRTVLVVDDEADLVGFIAEYLEDCGFQVVPHSDSKKALDTFSMDPDRFDLLITDQTMPGLSGTGLIEAVRRIRPGLPVIICTGFSETVSEQSAEAMGVGYLAKPLDPQLLNREILARLGD